MCLTWWGTRKKATTIIILDDEKLNEFPLILGANKTNKGVQHIYLKLA